MAEIPLQAEWIDAFWEEDGYQLLTLLRKEPRLLTIKNCGCNVLHLAMRHNWFLLVVEILRKFRHLYNDASFLGGSPSLWKFEIPGEEDSSEDVYGLDLASFRHLLEAKEDGGATSSRGKSAKWKYKSGLDVFAMAVIQGDAAINTLLAEAVLQVDGLFGHPHAYKDVFRIIGKETGESDFSADRHVEETELLREIIEKCFPVPDRIDVRIDRESETATCSNVSTSEQQRASDSQATPATSGPKLLRHLLEDKIYPEWTQEWELRGHFLPLAEFLFLACFSVRDRMLEEKRVEIHNRMLEAFQHSGKGISFRKYLLGIKDTRGSALHHMVRRGSHDWIRAMMGEDVDALADYINERDSAGRTPLYIALALGNMAVVKLLLEIKVIIRDNLKDTHWILNEVDKTCKEGVRWRFRGQVWLADVAIISTVNLACQASAMTRSTLNRVYGWQLDTAHQESGGPRHALEARRPSRHDLDDTCTLVTLATHAPQVVIQSPYLSDKDRSLLTRIYTEHTLGYCHRPTAGKITWLQLAAYLGDTATLEILANDDKVYDISRLNNSSSSSSRSTKYETVLHAAAAAGRLHVIRIILATRKFDPLIQDFNGNTALHLATHIQASLQFSYSLTDFFEILDGRISNSHQGESSLSTEERKDLIRITESRRQGCINLLLQAGIDVWQTNEVGEMADPGFEASSEYSTWWYEKVSKETQEARTSLNVAANAISVTAALVATASYVGPLQPPMGYSETLMDKMQVGILSVQIFIVCNTLAFYLALAAITLSLTPSLPMPRESILDELKLIRSTVTWAVGLLIMSMVAILVAFASASIAVIPNESSWNHGGLTISTFIICVPILILCLFRLLKLTFHKRKGVPREFYIMRRDYIGVFLQVLCMRICESCEMRMRALVFRFC